MTLNEIEWMTMIWCCVDRTDRITIELFMYGILIDNSVIDSGACHLYYWHGCWYFTGICGLHVL